MKMKTWVMGLAALMAVGTLAGGGQNKETETMKMSSQEVTEATEKGTVEPDAADIAWPENPIQIIVGANAGGGIDTAARLIAKYMEKELGQSIVVSNVAGGAGSIAATQVKDGKPDGYTMLVCHEALLTNRIPGSIRQTLT